MAASSSRTNGMPPSSSLCSRGLGLCRASLCAASRAMAPDDGRTAFDGVPDRASALPRSDLVRRTIRVAEHVLPRLRPLTAVEFLALELPPRGFVLDPWLPTQGLVMIHSARGIGKTLMALSIAYAVATGGGLLGWTAPMPRRVLYLDGEMPAAAMQRRLA